MEACGAGKKGWYFGGGCGILFPYRNELAITDGRNLTKYYGSYMKFVERCDIRVCPRQLPLPRGQRQKYPGGLRLAAGPGRGGQHHAALPPRQHRRGAGDPRPHRPLRPHPHAHQKRLPGPHHHHPAHGEPAGHHAPGLRPHPGAGRGVSEPQEQAGGPPRGAAHLHRGRCSAGAGVCADLRIWPNGADHR